MSPEQCRGETDVDERSDIYSFGCVLHEMLTGAHVFDAGTAEEFLRHHLSTPPESPNSHTPLDKVVLRCLEKESDNRYQGFAELEKDLARLYWDLTSQAVTPPEPEAALLEADELACKGFSLANLGLFDEAIDCAHGVLMINPSDPDAAIRELQLALTINPNYHEARNNLGSVYYRKGDIQAAIREYQEALRIDPNVGMVHTNLGGIYHEKGDFDGAIREFREALRINPNAEDAHFLLGMVHADKGEFDAAIREFEETLRINPNNTIAHNNLAFAHNAKRQGKRGRTV
jgi:tetratricopeptide (TPR) repeat protein